MSVNDSFGFKRRELHTGNLANRPHALDIFHPRNLLRGGVHVRHILELERCALEQFIVELQPVVHCNIRGSETVIEGFGSLTIDVRKQMRLPRARIHT
jgi:hypothetical protein